MNPSDHGTMHGPGRFGVQWLLPEAIFRWQRVTASQAALPAL